jgi:PleD family two-component response regulator
MSLGCHLRPAILGKAAGIQWAHEAAGGQMRILVTEDDDTLAAAVAAGLRREGMAVDVPLDGETALEHLAVNRYDVVTG